MGDIKKYYKEIIEYEAVYNTEYLIPQHKIDLRKIVVAKENFQYAVLSKKKDSH